MKGYKRIILLLLTLTYGCIDPFDIVINEEKRILTVEGYISTGPGPHRIKLSKSAKFGSVFDGVVRNEVSAKLWIRDNNGNVTILKEEGFGIYTTPVDWRAELNNSYTLNIITNDGTNYTSSPETIIPVAPIDSLIIQYKKLPTADPLAFISGVEVFARFLDPPDSRDFYIWRNNGTYLLETFPELYVIPGFGRISAPKDCCDICWINEINADLSVKILDDKNSNGTINTELAAFIPDDGGRFTETYMVVIQQLSISKEAHAFFDLLEKQLSIDGDIFDPPPATIRGNMINLDRQEENVIGFFHASDVSYDTVFVDRSVLQDFQKVRQVNDDCRELPFSTATIPGFWPEN